MREFQQKRKMRRALYSRVTLLVLLALLVVVARGALNVYKKERESRKQLDRVDAELSVLETRRAALAEQIERLKTPAGIEAEIREQFQVAKPGERMVVIVEEKGGEAAEPPQQRSFFSRFLGIFRIVR
ncbi:MAG: hypothetical protein Greene041679_508 [Parcubacteria group bacterium Greene0416_79]|nr:MAG: hypothetical protein Greene041679_508 [Parcubacteria group bacterium Greene0416_79]